jgi:hypothetical protein
MVAMLVLAGVLAVAGGRAAGRARLPTLPRVVVAVLPGNTTPQELGGVPRASLGLMSAGIGAVPAAQTYLDISQGNRTYSSLYDSSLPRTVGPATWQRVRSRAGSAPADIVPGLLGSTLKRAGVPVRATASARQARVVVADVAGRVPRPDRCALACHGLTVTATSIGRARALASSLEGRDLLIALAAPPPSRDHELPVAIAGRGFAGEVTSDSTHVSGLVSSTDLAPTILERFGIAAPDAMSGRPITASGEADPTGLASLDARLAAIPGRRSQTIGTSLAAWAVGAALIALALGRRGPRLALPPLAVTVAYLPLLTLITAALEPGATVETLVVALGAPALALASVRLVGPWRALAIAAAASVGSYAVDVVAGSHLTVVSLLGPDPAHGSRFYGIGNQLEAIFAALIPLGVGAALIGWREVAPRTAALVFAVVATLCVLAFAPGRFGADVGIAIDVPIGAAVAILVCLRERRAGALALVVAVPVATLGILAAIDLASGGNAHLTRSVLDAGGLHDLGQVAQRRLHLSAHNFAAYASSPLLWAAAAVIVAGLIGRRRVAAWFADRRFAWAGFLGAIAGTIAAVLANDSGGLMLVIGTVPISLAAGLAWATLPVNLDRRPGLCGSRSFPPTPGPTAAASTDTSSRWRAS